MYGVERQRALCRISDVIIGCMAYRLWWYIDNKYLVQINTSKLASS